jgi:cytochrome c oxidase subunit 2
LAAAIRWPLNYLSSDGPRANPVTALTWGLLALSVAVVIIITVAVVVGVLLNRSKIPASDLSDAPITGSRGGLGWIYIGMPLTVAALAVALFWTMQVLASVDSPHRRPALTIQVTGRQWWWDVRYLDAAGRSQFETANEIHIPVGQPVKIELFGGDVIHSFWVPALTGKTDTIPGRENLSWLQADHAGVFRGQCTEYCGVQHANMAVYVIAEDPATFETWRQAQIQPANFSPAPLATGEALFVSKCGDCHSIEGSPAHGLKGPDLTHLMSRRTLAAGVLNNTVDSLSGWISDPQTLKPGARMPATDLSGPQLHAVVAYLETLK